MTDWIKEAQDKAAQRVSDIMDMRVPTATLASPNPVAARADDAVIIGCDGVFDPWEIVGNMYGCYSSDFDECAIDVLQELLDGRPIRDDLGARMFREILCNLDLCDYGGSPRACFATPQFRALLPKLIEQWKQFYRVQWDLWPDPQ